MAMTHSTRTRKMDRIILALLEHGTIHQAATALGMSEVTVWRWTQKPEFQAAYAKARREALSRSGGRLLQGTNAAASTIMRIMLDPSTSPAVRVRAAGCVLEYGTKVIELEDLEVRVKRLEDAPKP